MSKIVVRAGLVEWVPVFLLGDVISTVDANDVADAAATGMIMVLGRSGWVDRVRGVITYIWPMLFGLSYGHKEVSWTGSAWRLDGWSVGQLVG